MIIALNGRRMGKTTTAQLIDDIEASEIDQMLTADGYRLQPVRAPRSLGRGRLSLRLVWQKVDGDQVSTVRLTHVFHHPRML